MFIFTDNSFLWLNSWHFFRTRFFNRRLEEVKTYTIHSARLLKLDRLVSLTSRTDTILVAFDTSRDRLKLLAVELIEVIVISLVYQALFIHTLIIDRVLIHMTFRNDEASVIIAGVACSTDFVGGPRLRTSVAATR